MLDSLVRVSRRVVHDSERKQEMPQHTALHTSPLVEQPWTYDHVDNGTEGLGSILESNVPGQKYRWVDH